MDRREPEESSSSPNVNLSIQNLQKRGAGKETVVVSLSDGSSFFMPLPVPEDWAAGRVLDEEEREMLALEDSYVRGKEWAAGRLAVREDSSGRLLQKLAQRGYGGDVGRRICEDLKELGFLDDARFAELWLRERLRSHPEGRTALTAGLMNRGVPGHTAREAVAENVSEEDLDEALEKCLAKFSSSAGGEEALMRKLYRRGFERTKIKNKMQRDNDH